MPNSVLPDSTGLLMNIDTSAVSQSVSVVQSPWFELRRGRNLVTPRSCPVTITSSPSTIGVMELLVDRETSGRSHSNSPLSAATPTTCAWVTVTICRTPPSSATIGDAYAGPSPSQVQTTSPLVASNAVSAPSFWPPR